jgi:hypothetical protein
VLKRIFGPKNDEVTGEWRKLNEELNDLYCSPNIVRVIKSRIRCAGHVAQMGTGEMHVEFWWGNPEGKSPLGRPSINGRIILRWILRKGDGGHGLD